MVLGGMIDPDCEGKFGLLIHNEGKGKYVWNTEVALVQLLVLLYIPCDKDQ